MKPPIQVDAIEARSLAALGGLYRQRSRWLALEDIVGLVDVWVILAVLWVSRATSGPLLAIELTFAVGTLAVLRCRTTTGKLTPSAIDDAGYIFKAVWLVYALLSALSLLAGLEGQQQLLLLALPTAPLLVGARGLSYALRGKLRPGDKPRRVLIVGGGEISQQVVAAISDHEEYGLKVIGVVDDDPELSSSQIGARLLGRVENLNEIVSSHHIDTVIVAYGSARSKEMVDVLREALAAGSTVWAVPRFFELGATSSADHLWGLPVVRLSPAADGRPGWRTKRLFDVVASTVALLLLSPLLGAIALLVYLDSGSPILLRQRRVGRGGRSFDMLKFRTMLPCDEETDATEWIADGDRTTRVGRILRDTSLDELPQFINVLKGDMSLVGPRPERPHFVELFSEKYPNYALRHRIPVGITGWSQIHGLRGDTSIEERATFDNYYIENWSMATDAKIMLRTLTAFNNHSKGGDS